MAHWDSQPKWTIAKPEWARWMVNKIPELSVGTHNSDSDTDSE